MMNPEIALLLIEYEQGSSSVAQTLKLFSLLVQTGLAWQMQGFYGRAAQQFIECGYLTEDGDLTELAEEHIHKEN